MSQTHSLPVQKLDASLANQAITPRSSSGLPIRPIGFKSDHFSKRWGWLSKYAAVILGIFMSMFQKIIQEEKTNLVYMWPGESEFTLIFFCPSSHAMLRVI